ncbi:MAG: septal ring lytic transglycosylase RlpA family protein [Thermoanaerobaculia bacterium]
MKTVLKRAGGAIPRLFLLSAAVGVLGDGSAAHADFVGQAPRRSVIASWYGPGFSGKRTASGDRFDPRALTCAHKTLPLGTKLRVTNPRTGAQVLVTVTDRGPYRGRRELDLSHAAAREVGIIGRGVAPVLIEIL